MSSRSLSSSPLHQFHPSSAPTLHCAVLTVSVKSISILSLFLLSMVAPKDYSFVVSIIWAVVGPNIGIVVGMVVQNYTPVVWFSAVFVSVVVKAISSTPITADSPLFIRVWHVIRLSGGSWECYYQLAFSLG